MIREFDFSYELIIFTYPHGLNLFAQLTEHAGIWDDGALSPLPNMLEAKSRETQKAEKRRTTT